MTPRNFRGVLKSGVGVVVLVWEQRKTAVNN
jgi:hypothetical protein